MLGKLLKHEFRATSRVMLPVFLALLALSVLANFAIRIMERDNNPIVLELACGLIVVAFSICLVAAILITVILMVQRFHNNLLTDEGYLMFTLPTSIHNLICSKIIVSVVWFILTIVVILLSALLCCMNMEMLTSFSQVMHQLLQGLPMLTSIETVSNLGFIIEGIVLVLVCCSILCLEFYAAMAVGYGFANRKGLMSVIFFFIFQFVSQFLTTALLLLATDNPVSIHFMDELAVTLSGPAQVHVAMLIIIAFCLIYFAIFYVITALSLKKRLNLE